MVACPCARHCAEAPHTPGLGDDAAVAARHRRLPVLESVRRPRSAGGPAAAAPRRADATGSYRGRRKPDQPVPDGHQRRFGDGVPRTPRCPVADARASWGAARSARAASRAAAGEARGAGRYAGSAVARSASPGPARVTIAQLRAAERASAAGLVQRLATVEPALAQLFASIAASHATHVTVLAENRRGS